MLVSFPILFKLDIKRKLIFSGVALLILVALVPHLFAQNHVPTSYSSLVLSPSGSKVASAGFDTVQGKASIIVVDQGGTVGTFLFDRSIFSQASWSSADDLIFLRRHSDSNSIGSAEYTICRFNTKSPGGFTSIPNEHTVRSPSSSPSNNYVSYSDYEADSPYSKVVIYDIKSGVKHDINSYLISPVSRISWSKDGNVVAFSGSQNGLQFPFTDKKSDGGGLVWATAKDNFVPHFIKSNFYYFEPNLDGSHFVIQAGRDDKGWRHTLQVVDSNGVEVAKLKRETSIAPDMAWNDSGTAVFFFDNFYTGKLQLCRWDIKTGEVTVLQPLDGLRGKILGYRNGAVFYATANWDEKNSCQINQITTD